MELKKFEEYSQEDKETLLRHWIMYFGKELINFAELEELARLCHENTSDMWEVAVSDFMSGANNSTLVAIRKGKVDELFKKIRESRKKTLSKEISKQNYEKAKQRLLYQLVNTYNHPEQTFLCQKKNLHQSFNGWGQKMF